ncbi:hypothetical protein ACIBL3_00285 [Kribbella sp. NPDC050124]|uniref:hypothetical protein n=1 Tax=Kribbella sp. NPDC050124 TaxID=3364114 RepID=UPI0037AB834B
MTAESVEGSWIQLDSSHADEWIGGEVSSEDYFREAFAAARAEAQAEVDEYIHSAD